LTFDVDPGYELNVSSFSFYHRSSYTGYQNYSLTINGIPVSPPPSSGADTIYVDVSGGSHVMRSTGTLVVSNPVTNLMGKVTVEVTLSNRTGNQGTFRIDNFTLNGYVTPIDSSVYNSVPGRYRYGFNGKENDNEVKGEGNSLDFGLRVYDPRIGRFLSSDPMGGARVSWTPYNAMRNNPLNYIDPTGGLDEWVQTKDGQTLWDDKVTDQKSATQRYGDGATYRGPGYSYTSKAGESVTLGSNRSFTVNGTSKTAVNSTNPYDPGTFTYWNYTNGRNYDSQVEAYRAWQSYSGYHPGEGRWDKIFRGTAYASMEARRDYSSGGMNMFGGAGRVVNIPRGFTSSEQFAQAGSELRGALEEAGISYSNVGVRGSAVTNMSSKGGAFRETALGNLKASDIDVFINLSEDIGLNASKNINGFIHPAKLLRQYPTLLEWSEKWTKILGREITPGAFKPGTFNDTNVINF
ncbi:RHS repeat-associated core domain-containing protein, partial [Chitinophaga sp. 30R24]|uniref:RHS repeat-associated core domain-containing protein n=1 Tax=Chitinophaga sp. 30R24 TaxID=3248838 RepID=UPI003B909EAD